MFPLLHPHPSNPAGNRKWNNTCNDQLVFAGVPQVLYNLSFCSSLIKITIIANYDNYYSGVIIALILPGLISLSPPYDTIPQIIAGSEFMNSALAMNSGEKKKKRCSKDE